MRSGDTPRGRSTPARGAGARRRERGRTEFLLEDENAIYELESICGSNAPGARHTYVGPIFWEGWEEFCEPVPPRRGGRPTIYLNCGTLTKSGRIVHVIVEECRRRGANVLVSSGIEGPMEVAPHVFCKPLLSPRGATEGADLVVCTGGIGACYTNLRHGVPTLVVPMQPEQATNGHNLERAGCGRVLANEIVFAGDGHLYATAVQPHALGALLEETLHPARPWSGLATARCEIAACDTRDKVVRLARSLT